MNQKSATDDRKINQPNNANEKVVSRVVARDAEIKSKNRVSIPFLHSKRLILKRWSTAKPHGDKVIVAPPATKIQADLN